jgi:4-amino-4-deoxy-L-arabinose transferase-like glycosyltransferase
VHADRIERQFRRWAAFLSVAGALHGLVYLPFVDAHSVTDSNTYVAAAHALARRSYKTPLNAGLYYTFPVGYFELSGVYMGRDFERWDVPERQAFRPPGYPAFLTLTGGGDRGAREMATMLLQAAAFGFGIWLLALTVRRWWGARTALAATALYVLDPYSKHYVVLILSETLCALLVLACTYAFTRAWSNRAARWWAATGVLAGSVSLVRAVFVLVVPLLVVAVLLRNASAAGRVRAATAVAAGAAVLLVPWLAWTQHVGGRATMAVWGEGYNLLWGAHGEGYGRPASEVEAGAPFQADLRRVHERFPSARELRSDPEAHPRYLASADEELRSRAWSVYRERLGDEPGRVLGEIGYRAGFLWSAHEDWYQPSGAPLRLLELLDGLLILLALAGIALAARCGGAPAAVAVFLLAYTAALVLHHVEARFAIPLRGLLLAFVSRALLEIPALGTRIARRG